MATRNHISNATKTLLASVAALAGSGTAMSAGASSGTIETAGTLLGMFCTIFVPLCVGGLWADHKHNQQLKQNQLAKRDELTRIAQRYNEVTQLLEYSFDEEKRHLNRRQKEKLRKEYEQKYYENKAAFDRERTEYLSTTDTTTATSQRFSRFWQWLIGLGLFAQLAACSYTLGIDTNPETPQMAVATAQAQDEPTYWNADNIPMPHLQDATRYVANPDGVVTTHTEDLLNQWFKKMDDSLQIESAVILVNHVENDDPFRLAQDVGNKYGVGKGDRGLIIVLGYEDHSINISPGRSLEADLTDAECARLQREYVIPSMKAMQPDSGMLYLAEAIYNTLQKKELPRMSALSSSADDEEGDTQFAMLAFYFLLFGGWSVLIAYLRNRYYGGNGANLFAANPFAKEPEAVFVSTGGGGLGGGSFGGGGGGFGGGGSFGGGSFGGGGATSRW